MADGHDFEKNVKYDISSAVHEIWYDDAYSPPNLTVNRKFKNLEIQDGGRRPS